MVKMLDEGIQKQVKDVFADLNHPVEVVFFKREDDCEYCDQTQQLLQEVVDLSEKLSLSVYDFDENADLAKKYGVDKTPGFVLLGKQDGQSIDYGIRFSGIPAGHEFTSLINDLVLVSKGESNLSHQTKSFLAGLTRPVHMMVFVTPTCPYCPRAVVLAHQMALESSMVTAEMVEAMEFPELSDKYEVSGVPQTTINFGAGTVVGAVPEQNLIREIQQALKAGG